MSITVPAYVPPPFRAEPKLTAVPSQPTSKTREVIEQEAAQRSVDSQFPLVAELVAAPPAPRTWSFTDRWTGKRLEVTCLPGCIVSHDREIALGATSDDIWCMTRDPGDAWMPVSTGGQQANEVRVLGANLRQDPFSNDMSKRVPHAVVEVLEDSFIEPLDPDGLATVILALEAQLKQMREMHAQLVELREQGRIQL